MNQAVIQKQAGLNVKQKVKMIKQTILVLKEIACTVDLQGETGDLLIDIIEMQIEGEVNARDSKADLEREIDILGILPQEGETQEKEVKDLQKGIERGEEGLEMKNQNQERLVALVKINKGVLDLDPTNLQ